MSMNKGFRSTGGGFRKKTASLGSQDAQDNYLNIPMLKGHLTESGQIVPSRVTGLTAKEQREMTHAIKLARFLALLPYVG